MGILETVKSGVVQRALDKQSHKSSGKFKPSSFGKCFRRQVLERLGVPRSQDIIIESELIKQDGIDKHNFIQSFYPKECCEVRFEDEHFKGFADIVTEDTVIDIKTVNTEAYTKMGKKGYSIYQNKEANILQAGFYAIKLNKPSFELAFLDREAFSRSGGLAIACFSFDTAFLTQFILKEVDKLIEFWYNVNNSGVLPECEDRLFFGHECKFCEYKIECERRKNGA